MRIAFVGTRGVPATYSGFETFVENLGTRLAGRGHEVTVYCRKHHHQQRMRRYRGMELHYVRGVRTKHLDTITHTLVSCLHTLWRRYDLVVMCISGNSPMALLAHLGGARVVLNVDGSDWRRQKWGRLARAYIRFSEWLAVRLPDATVTDSRVMHRYYRQQFGAETDCIAYGADLAPPSTSRVLDELGLRPRQYILWVGRLVPENCADHLVEAFGQLQTEMKCVVVGDAPYAARYIKDLHRKGPGVIFPGYVFGEGYRELMYNAYAFVLCSEVGGTHPVLIEAMSAGNCVVVNDTPANLEVIGDAGLAYAGERGSEALLEVLQQLLNDSGHVARLRERAADRSHRLYSWDAVTQQYEDLFARVLKGGEHKEREAVSSSSGAGQ